MEPAIGPHRKPWGRPRKNSGTSPAGITLIELTIVIVLLAIVASFSVPRFFMVTEINLRTATRTLAETLREVSAMATNVSKPFVVQYDLDKGKYCYKLAMFDAATGRWVAQIAAEGVEQIGGEPYSKTKWFTLEKGAFFKDMEPLTGTEKKVEKGLQDQWFQPRGIIDPMVIHLGDRKGRSYTVILNRYGGSVEIRKGRWEYKEYLRDILE